MNRIALCIRNRRDREHITKWLSNRYEVVTLDRRSQGSLDFDLCIVDAASLNRHKEALHTRREEQQPVFLPILLIARGHRALKHQRRLLADVDEIIWAPIARAELDARIAALLRIRNLAQLVQQRYISLANHSNALVLVVRTGRIQYANEAVTRVFSGLPDQAPMVHLIAHEHRRLFEQYMEQVASHAQGETADLENPVPTHVEVRLNTEAEKWAHVNAAPTFENDDHEFLILMLDVTESKIQERRLRESRRRIQSLAGQLVSVEQRERATLAADIHDGVNQSLASLRMRLDLLSKNPQQLDLQEELVAMREILDNAITQTRSLIVDLDPPSIRESGLSASLSALVDRFRESHGLEVAFEADNHGVFETHKLPTSLQHVLYRATRELLFNVLKHAPNASAYVTLHNVDSDIAITVSDDGPGFDPDETMPGSGFGLFSLRERLRPFDGTVDIRSAPGRGTIVEIRAAQPTGEEKTYEETNPTC